MTQIIIVVVFIAIVAGLYFEMKPNSNKATAELENPQSSVVKEKSRNTELSPRYTGNKVKENYVYAGAMNLAWNELSDNILHDKINLRTDDTKALALAAIFNTAPFSTKDLDIPSYYIKSGFGQKTINTINTEVKSKFPNKSFSDLNLIVGEKDLVSYAYFLKKVEYVTAFTSLPIFFMGQQVEGFLKYTDNKEQQKNVQIINYQNDDKFILSLLLKDNTDELFVAKGYDGSTPEEVVEEINMESKNKTQTTMGPNDNFQMPKISFSYQRNYDEMMYKPLANKGFEEYSVGAMFENIAFDIDEKGARVENEALMMIQKAPKPQKIRNLLLNKPFWIVMKRHDSQNPYLILQINNMEFMKKVQN